MSGPTSWHLRITGAWNEETQNWVVVREGGDGRPLAGNEVWRDGWGVVDLGDGINAARSRGVDIHASDEVIELMRAERGDAWWPRHPEVRA